MEIRYELGDRVLTEEEQALLEREKPRIRHELTVRFGKVVCPDAGCPRHGQGVEVAVVDLAAFPALDFTFADRCCDAMERALVEAARAR